MESQTMDNLKRALAEHPFFKAFQPRHLHYILDSASEGRFEIGEYLFRKGEAATHFFLIREGQVTLELTAPFRSPITVQTVGPGETLGWSWFLSPYRWHFNARAVEPVSAILLDAGVLLDKCEQDHDLGYALAKRCVAMEAERIDATVFMLLDMYGTH